MDRLKLLLSACPDWFEPVGHSLLAFTGKARIGPWENEGVLLRIQDALSPRVGEAIPGSAFPAACSERHIEGTGLFCTGLHATPLKTTRDARRWWSKLEQYLCCQAAATATGVWPIGHGLDHGDAGEPHRRALRLAQRLGVEDAYLSAYMGEPSWFTSTGLDLLGERRRPGQVKRPRLRAPQVRGRRARLALLEIVMLERLRKRELTAFWVNQRRSGRVCCGTMRDCHLAGPTVSVDRIEEKAA